MSRRGRNTECGKQVAPGGVMSDPWTGEIAGPYGPSL